MIGFIILIVLAIKIYRSAKESERNAIAWTAASVAVYVGVQLLIGFGLAILLSVGHNYFGWSEHALDNFVIPITFLSVILSLVAVWTIANYLANETIHSSAVQQPKT